MTEKDFIETQDKQGEPKHRATSQPTMEKFGVVDENGDVVGWLKDDGAGGVEVEHVSGETVRLDEDGLHSEKLSTDKETINHGLERGRNGERIDAAKYDGATADDRLANAISDASDYDTIYLEKAAYTQDITDGTRILLVGTGIEGGTVIDATWSFSSPVTLQYAEIEGSLEINAFGAKVTHCAGGGMITDAGGSNIYSCLARLSITFESGTSGSIVDSSVNVTVTDNGSNTVGDIA